MSPETWSAIEEIFSKHPIMKAESVSFDEIDTVAAASGIQFPKDYREFIHRYGGAIVGPYPIFGLRRASAMARTDGSVIEVTHNYRRQGWRGVDGWLVFSVDHAGNPIGLDNDGGVWISDHDAGAVEEIAKSFEEYLRKHCLKLA